MADQTISSNQDDLLKDFAAAESAYSGDLESIVDSQMAETYDILPDNEFSTEDNFSSTPEPESNPANYSPKKASYSWSRGKEYTPEEKKAYFAKMRSLGFTFTKKNQMAFYDAVKNKKLPAFNPIEGERISAVKSFKENKAYQGLNQLIGQKYVRDLGFKKSPDGDYHVITLPQAGFYGNLTRGRNTPHYTFSTYNNAKVVNKQTGELVPMKDPDGQEVKPFFNIYTVYSLGDVVDLLKIKTFPDEQRSQRKKSEITVDATDANMSGKEYLKKYLAATQAGFIFRTTPEVQESMRQKILKDLEKYVQTEEHWKIGQYVSDISKESQAFVKEEYQKRAQELLNKKNREKTPVNVLAQEAAGIER